MTLDLHVAVALDHILLTSLHRRLLRWGIGSSGVEGLSAAHSTSSLDNSTLIAPMPLSDLSVKPVPKSYLVLILSGTKNYTDARASVLPTTIGCTDGATSV